MYPLQQGEYHDTPEASPFLRVHLISITYTREKPSSLAAQVQRDLGLPDCAVNDPPSIEQS